jgi:hypothetical protein
MMTNAEFSQKDNLFLKVCKMAGIKPTIRQAAKFRMGKGAAFKIVVCCQSDIHIPEPSKV